MRRAGRSLGNVRSEFLVAIALVDVGFLVACT